MRPDHLFNPRLRSIRSIAMALAITLIAACGHTPPGAAKAAPAAKVQNPKAEADLSTITLSPEAEKHLALETADVARVMISETRTVGGEAIVAPGKLVIVTAPVAGTLSAPAGGPPSIGPVAKGAVLFELMSLQPGDRDALTSAQRDAEETEARALALDQRVRRIEGLLKEGAASERSLEEARSDRTAATAAATAAASRLSALRRLPMGSRGELSLAAPFAGAVTAIRAVAGQTVAAGAPIAEVADVTSLWIRVPLYAGDAGQFDDARTASVAALGHEIAGPWRDVRRIAGPPTANAGAASVDLFYELSAAGAIRPGERVAVRLPLTHATAMRAIVVPASAVIYDIHGGTWVYEAKGSHAFARRRVEVSGSSGSSLVISRGLAEGVRIVTVGAAELYGTEFYVSK